MALFTRVEKRNEKLQKLYQEGLVKGLRPERAAKEAKENLNKPKGVSIEQAKKIALEAEEHNG